MSEDSSPVTEPKKFESAGGRKNSNRLIDEYKKKHKIGPYADGN